MAQLVDATWSASNNVPPGRPTTDPVAGVPHEVPVERRHLPVEAVGLLVPVAPQALVGHSRKIITSGRISRVTLRSATGALTAFGGTCVPGGGCGRRFSAF